jgi:hypothetical protein
MRRSAFVHWTSIAFLLVSFHPANGMVLDFVGPCSSKPILTETLNPSLGTNVGQLTVDALDRNRIPYRGSASGIAEAFGAPSGLDATVVLSDQEMLSYGWCYSVDGVAPDVYPDQVPVTAKTQKIEWFYAYSHYLKGDWIAQCVHAWKRPLPNHCNSR